MTERLLSLLDRFVYSAARHGSYLLVLLAAVAYNAETVAPSRGYVVIENSDPGEQTKAVVTYGRTLHDTEQVVFGLKTDIAPATGLDRTGSLRRTVETYSISQTIRHFDPRGPPVGVSRAV
ncbi:MULTISPECIES: hypothetical protein [unclassified Beijerinckia]|uniref:hypothetical protein n=1 Tax=unclassified Beijerinckia TaxID=2638183 RepID=UPI00089AD406|nr:MULTISPECIES: hypothetical protein [unclassified Beijerinckia]MDH7797418.1 hypothetical protein [Beijerinckia sp. GAS462]SEC84714.1 hypothetical protein SAMN05443249_3712 [Beijerinckia sp. 28-YEA-48]